MADQCVYKKDVGGLVHFPTWILIVGYPVFWLEMLVFRAETGQTGWTAVFLLAFVWGVLLLKNGRGRNILSGLKERASCTWAERTVLGRLVLFSSVFLAVFLILLALNASLYPPHHPQEYDVLNYHYSLPRQHLILGSFAHIPWSSADLWPFPVQFAMAPFWFVTPLPNKFPQLIFLIGLLAVSAQLTHRLSGKRINALWCFLALLGSHGLGVQMGTAMLDITLTYLFIAAVDSFFSRRWIMAAIEFSFFFWSKPLLPPFMIAVLSLTLTAVWLCRTLFKQRVCFGFAESQPGRGEKPVPVKKIAVTIVLSGLIIGGPFAAKATYYSGTPFYPVFLGQRQTRCALARDRDVWNSVLAAARDHRSARDSYGGPGGDRSLKAFIQHLWLLAVPEQGVNNRFDYPLGLPYLLVLGPFLFFSVRSLRKGSIPVAGFFVISYWVVWWQGTQQSRFLFVPLVLMFILVFARTQDEQKILPGLLLLSVLLTTLSVARAFRFDVGKDLFSVLRTKDAALVQKSRDYIASGSVETLILPEHEVAFARFPVMVQPERLPWVIKTSK